MARLRYVTDLARPARASAGGRGAAIDHTVRSLRARYETAPEIARAVLPPPLEPAGSPEGFAQVADVAMHLSRDRTVQVRAATVGVACSYEGCAGYYVLAMPMEGEDSVLRGRERYGEPKKLAKLEFTVGPAPASASEGRCDGAPIVAKVERHDVAFLELRGQVGAELDAPLRFTERFYCFKAMPAAGATGGFDGDVFLTRLLWERDYTSRRRVDAGEIVVRDSPYDPLADVPVRRLISMELAEGASRTSGEVVRAVPGDWLEAFVGQRYDTPQAGVEVLTTEAGRDRDA